MELNDIAERLDKVFDSYEIFYLKERAKRYESRDLHIYGYEFKEEEGVAVRGIKDKKLVFSYSYNLNDRGLDKLLTNSIELLPYIDRDDDNGFLVATKNYPVLNLYDQDGIGIDDDTKKEMAITIERSMKDFDSKIVATRGCELNETDIEIKIINSNNIHASTKKTLYVITGMAVAREKDEVSWYDWQWSYFLKDLKIKDFGSRIAEKAISFLESRQIETGIYDGILRPQAACDILSILSGSFLSENLFKNKTKLKDRIEKKCFSEVINITDSGSVGLGASPFDGEGMALSNNSVVKNGVFLTFLYDVYYGKKFSVTSTGNSVRFNLKEPPRCGVRGMFIEKGNINLHNDAISDGIIIEELIGTHTANPITGDFSLGAIGYLIKNKKKTPFKEVIFSGNVFDLLNNVRAVGTDLKFYGIYGSPSLFIEGMKISGR